MYIQEGFKDQYTLSNKDIESIRKEGLILAAGEIKK
jgi:hypothetical protein